MRPILIITYYWPPSGGAGVQRWLSFANEMVQAGRDVHVLTVDEGYATYQLIDKSLATQVHPAIKVYKTKTREPFKAFTFLFGKNSMPKPAFSNESNPSFFKKLSRFIRGNLFIPDPRKGWKPFALKTAMQILSAEKFACVITAGPPHSTHFIGKSLKERLGIYWVADFHDLWTDVIYYDMLYHLPPVKKRDRLLERMILETADKIITIGEKYKTKLLSKSSALAPEKIIIARIGYDEKVFSTIETPIPSPETFTIAYTGTISDFYHPDIFIAALQQTVARFPDVHFKLVFAGILSDHLIKKIEKAGLQSILDYRGYLSHADSVRVLKAATVLLLVNPVTRDEEMVIPGKVYEYLAAGKPIINITTHRAETALLIDGCGAGKTFDRSEERQLTAYLMELVAGWKNSRSLEPNTRSTEQYSRKAITATLLKQLPD